MREQFGGSKLHFLDKPFDVESAAAACDLAVTNGNHGTTSAVLLAGKPVLVVPTVTEQHMLGERVEAMGAGRLARPDDLEAVIGGLVRLLRENCFRKAAASFRAQYAAVRTDDIVSRIVSSIERHLGAA